MIVRQEVKTNERSTITNNVSESILSLEDAAGQGRGTGFVVDDKDGNQIIVTNAHVCEGAASSIFAVFHRSDYSVRVKTRFPALVIKKDPEHDLCLVSMPSSLKVDSIPLADDVLLDEHVYIIGYPYTTLLSSSDGYIRGSIVIDNIYELPPELCVGKKHYMKTVPIKQKNKKKTDTKVCMLKAEFLFTDAEGEFGASGSPALNSSGEIIGVMSMIAGEARPFAHLVPLESLKKFLSTQ